MPGFNKTGPMGMGPRTGGGRGFCAPEAETRNGSGRARGAGRGTAPFGGNKGRVCGGGRARQWFGPAEGQFGSAGRETELDLLKDQAGMLEDELAAIRHKIDDLSRQPAE